LKLAVSNLAWLPSEEEEALNTLKECGISLVEVAFSKLNSWEKINKEDLLRFKEKMNKYGLTCQSSQSLFYGMNINLLDSSGVIAHFKKLISLCEIMDIEVLVFGSPKMRVGTIEDALKVMYELDYMLMNKNVKVALEPNSKFYGGNYWFTLEEISNSLGDSFMNISSMIDSHNSKLESSDINLELEKHRNIVGHIHISEINLKPLVDLDRHKSFAQTLKKASYDKIVTYEVLSGDNVLESIKTFSEIYESSIG
jgi:sugar phosphate isomerase/epimerase